MDIQFANAKLLLLLWLAPLVGLWWHYARRSRERAVAAFVASPMQRKLVPRADSARFGLQVSLTLAGLCLCLVAAARPQWGQREELVFQRGRDLMIALDVSRSMLANDVRPNRLQRAKTDLLDLIRELEGDRAGLIVFRHKANLVCPLTTDYAFLRQALDAANPNVAPPGETDIGDAIQKAIEAFDTETSSHKAIVLVSDGEDLEGRARSAAEEARDAGIMIFTVGIGSSAGGRIPSEDGKTPYAHHEDKPIVTKREDSTLKQIAKISRGVYVPIGTAGMATTTLGTLYRDHLRRIDTRDIEERLQRRHIERFQWFLLPGVLLLIAATWLSRGRLATGKRLARQADAAGVALLAGLLALTTGTARAQTNTVPHSETNALITVAVPAGRTGARLAQKYFASGDYARAAEAYLRAAEGATPESRADFRYNAAVALYRDKQYDRSVQILEELQHDAEGVEARTMAALGAAQFRAAQAIEGDDANTATAREEALRESADAFRRASRKLPGAGGQNQRRNLAVTSKLLQSATEEAKIRGLVERYGSQPPDQLLLKMLTEQRALTEAIAAAQVEDSPEQVYALETIAKRQQENADLWIPLKGALLNAIAASPESNTQQRAAMMEQYIEQTRDRMHAAAADLRDLQPNAERGSIEAQSAIYGMWKPVAPYEALLAEDLYRQTNLVMASQSAAPRDRLQSEQAEASRLTSLFRERFTQMVPEEGLPPPETSPPPDNDPAIDTEATNEGMTAETRRQVLELTEQAEAAQSGSLEALDRGDDSASLLLQQEAYRILKEIETLLPRQEQEQNQNQEQKNEEQNQQQNQPSASEDKQQPPEKDSQDQQASNETEPEPSQDDEQESTEAPGEEEPLPDDVERMLERALQREREHMEAVQRRRGQQQSLGSERDW